MISRPEAERIAAEWARRETLRLGYECTPMLSEFDVGYVVWSKLPPDVVSVPGSGATTVIDKETGEVSSWPALPPTVVQDMYRRGRAARLGGLRTVDPTLELRRNTGRAVTPGAAAHLTVQYDQHIAHGAKGEVELRHHPLVRDYLDDLPPGHLVRGGERHAELIVVSDVLHEYDRRQAAAGQPPLTEETARELLGSSYLELFRIREPGDPAGGPAERPCDSCVKALVYFGVLPWSHLAFAQEWHPAPQPVPVPGRFPAEVAHALVEAGWRPGTGDDVLADAAIARVAAVPGREFRHEAFPAAKVALTAFPGLVSGRRGPGEQVWVRRFEINPGSVAHTADTLGDLARLIGCRLFPIGSEGGDSILAVDERGRVFALDQGGEWFVGFDIDTALTNLLLGRAPARLHDDGTW
ncbi:SUKH-3 domain-containing protein [Polymorphospora sp. NPDC051019]|uniref:SUKH-3 domain-containing protein n=1 Tax=Polymorphospora sp. NPDC051019 TaxID=3155725 RepID=UPI003436B2DA